METIQSPADVKHLSDADTERLCGELRRFLVEQVSCTGGHLASNLGAVELTVAIHRVFDTASDRLVFDVGHQCYVHKALTGRRELFGTLRQFGGLSGFPKPYESQHDAFMAGHASDSVSVALGMARAQTLLGRDYHVLAVIGDGALGGGLSFEGLNDAGGSGERLIVVLNDNGMSIDANVGGLNKYLVDLNGTWSNTASFDYMQTILAQYNEANGNMVELVICNNDDMALGAVNALQNAGYNLPGGENCTVIPVFGVDATDAAKELIANKQMTGSIKQDAEGMADAVATITANMIEGKDKFEGLNENYEVVDGWTVNIPYSIYTGE